MDFPFSQNINHINGKSKAGAKTKYTHTKSYVNKRPHENRHWYRHRHQHQFRTYKELQPRERMYDTSQNEEQKKKNMERSSVRR